ncbi:MAG TPA: DUF2304 domain-containing protein [Ignavibacteriaceae bacterium]
MNPTEVTFGPINPRTQLLSITASLILFIFIYLLVKKGYLKSGYSILWFLVSILIFIVSLFIDILYWFSALTGIYYPTSAIFSILIVGIILISIHYSVEISRHDKKITDLARELSLLKVKLDQKKATKKVKAQ